MINGTWGMGLAETDSTGGEAGRSLVMFLVVLSLSSILRIARSGRTQVSFTHITHRVADVPGVTTSVDYRGIGRDPKKHHYHN